MEAGFDFSFPENLSMFWGVWQAGRQAALSLPASCSPYRAMHPGWGEKLLVSLPAPLPPPANQSSSSSSAHSQHCCFARRSASGGKDTPACCSSFKQHGTSSVRRPTLHSWHLFQSRSAFTLGKQSNTDFETFKPCLPTLILTSSPLRRTQLAESNTVFASNSMLAKTCRRIQRESSRSQLTMADTPVNCFNIGDWVESERDDTRGL